MEPINWYPGHMAKARRELSESLKLIDVAVEIADARAPLATRNPDLDVLLAGKARILLLNKSDLADDAATRGWLAYYERTGIPAGRIVSTGSGRTEAARLIEQAAKELVERQKNKGVRKTVRALVCGIPNVGKSTFINRIAGEARTKTADRPGVTKGRQWVRVTPYLELLDTPGLLWPKLEDQTLARHLAYLGSVNDEILEIETLAKELLLDLKTICPDALYGRYRKLLPETPEDGMLEAVAKSRGFILRGGEADTERAARVLLDEFRGGKIARITLERAPASKENCPQGGTDAETE